jgi:hypothetical protein
MNLPRLPDTRGWVALGLFLLTGYVLHLLAKYPALASTQLFIVLATAIVVSGLIGGVVAYLFGTSKSSGDKDATIAKALDAKPDPTPPPAPAPD